MEVHVCNVSEMETKEVLLDIRKAFDSLDHCVLLRRLFDLGVSCVALHWFRDYLTDRYHRVKCQGQFSSWQNMKGGIPQGSALGPLLFLVYMNTLPSVIILVLVHFCNMLMIPL